VIFNALAAQVTSQRDHSSGHRWSPVLQFIEFLGHWFQRKLTKSFCKHSREGISLELDHFVSVG